jgi:hypothetical protein
VIHPSYHDFIELAHCDLETYENTAMDTRLGTLIPIQHIPHCPVLLPSSVKLSLENLVVPGIEPGPLDL